MGNHWWIHATCSKYININDCTKKLNYSFNDCLHSIQSTNWLVWTQLCRTHKFLMDLVLAFGKNIFLATELANAIGVSMVLYIRCNRWIAWYVRSYVFRTNSYTFTIPSYPHCSLPFRSDSHPSSHPSQQRPRSSTVWKSERWLLARRLRPSENEEIREIDGVGG